MPETQFEPFGEPVSGGLSAPSSQDDGQTKRARVLLRSGVGLFWTLVIAVVAMRVTYFDPDFAQRFGNPAALAKAIFALFA